MKLYWHAKRPPTRRELAAIRRGVRSGAIKSGAHIAPSSGVRPNPSGAAADAYERFHWGKRPKRILRAELPDLRQGVYELGELVAVEYRTTKGRERATWRHSFDRPRPKLTGTPAGKLGPILGGSAHITERGIEG